MYRRRMCWVIIIIIIIKSHGLDARWHPTPAYNGQLLQLLRALPYGSIVPFVLVGTVPNGIEPTAFDHSSSDIINNARGADLTAVCVADNSHLNTKHLYYLSSLPLVCQTLVKCTWCAAGKIHISDATKAALESNSDGGFDVELRGETEIKVRQVNYRYELI